MSARAGSSTKSILIFAGIFLGALAVASFSMRRGNEQKNPELQPVVVSLAETPEEDNQQQKLAADQQKFAAELLKRTQKDEAIAAEVWAAQERNRKAELLGEQQEKEKAVLTKQEAHKAKLAAIARDKRLRAESAGSLSAPAPIRVSLADGTLEVSYPYSTLYMLTGYIQSNRSPVTYVDDAPLYHAGGSELHLSVSYTLNGKIDRGTDDWFKIAGKPYKLSVNTSDEKILKAKFVQQILEPIAPGEVTITVSLAGSSVKIPILVVPLNIAQGESVDGVIGKVGLPDDDLYVISTWPESITVQNLFYHDDLSGQSRSSAHHWKFISFPGAVVVVDMNKVVNVSSTSPEYVWPKDKK